jgi:hypothetical protein
MLIATAMAGAGESGAPARPPEPSGSGRLVS